MSVLTADSATTLFQRDEILSSETKNMAAIFLADYFGASCRRTCEKSAVRNYKKGNGDRCKAGVGTPVVQVLAWNC
jgi:hypothetical protein